MIAATVTCTCTIHLYSVKWTCTCRTCKVLWTLHCVFTLGKYNLHIDEAFSTWAAYTHLLVVGFCYQLRGPGGQFTMSPGWWGQRSSPDALYRQRGEDGVWWACRIQHEAGGPGRMLHPSLPRLPWQRCGLCWVKIRRFTTSQGTCMCLYVYKLLYDTPIEGIITTHVYVYVYMYMYYPPRYLFLPSFSPPKTVHLFVVCVCVCECVSLLHAQYLRIHMYMYVL